MSKQQHQDLTHLNRAKESWDLTDKNSIGEMDIPTMIRMIDYLFILAFNAYGSNPDERTNAANGTITNSLLS